MDRERMLGPADPAAQEGESFIEEQERRWGKFGTVLIGLSCVAAYRTYTMLTDDGRAAVTPSALEQGLEQAAAELRMQLPRAVDEVTTLTAASVEGRRFVYELRVSLDIPVQDIETARSAMQTGNSRDICAQPATRDIVRQGAVLVHRYTDRSGDKFETQVNSCSA